MKTYTQTEVLAVIAQEAEETSVRAVARRLGMNAGYISDILLGRRGISEAVAEAFGFEREIVTEVRFRKAS